MFGSFILDMAVCMVFIYLLLSLVASGVNEILASLVQSRAANLERGLRSLFSGDSITAGPLSLVDNIYDHGLIRGLYPDPEMDLRDRDAAGKILPFEFVLSWWVKLRLWLQKAVGIAPSKAIAGVKNPLLLPSYIPARTFALAMIDILSKTQVDGKTPIENIEDFLRRHHELFEKNKAVEALLTLAVDAKNDEKEAYQKLQKFQANLENWYNDAMDRVSGWYKRYTQRVLLVVGLILAVAFNVNSISIAHLLWVNHDVRTGMADAATEYWKNHKTAPPEANAPGTGKSGTGQPAGAQAGASDATGQSGSTTNPSPDANTSGSSSQAATDNANAQQASATATGTDSTAQSSEEDLTNRLKSSVEAFNKVSNDYLLPVGWRHSRCDYLTWWKKYPSDMALNAIITLAGWLITAGALSLGASFWFDMLNKIMVVRNTVKPQEKSQTEGSKDN